MTVLILSIVLLSLAGCKNEPVHEHKYVIDESKWESDETNHWRLEVCECGDKREVNIEAHSYGEWIEETPAKPGIKGEKRKYCVCGVYLSEEIDALPEAEGSLVVEAVLDKTYDGKAVSIDKTKVFRMKDGAKVQVPADKLAVSYKSGDGEYSETEPMNAGRYTAKVTASDTTTDWEQKEKEIEFTIEKKSLAGTCDFKSLYAGARSSVTYNGTRFYFDLDTDDTGIGIVEGETISLVFDVDKDAGVHKAKVVSLNRTAAGNYEIGELYAEIEIYPRTINDAIPAFSREYNGKNDAFTYSAWSDSSNVLDEDKTKLTLEVRMKSKDAGSAIDSTVFLLDGKKTDNYVLASTTAVNASITPVVLERLKLTMPYENVGKIEANLPKKIDVKTTSGDTLTVAIFPYNTEIDHRYALQTYNLIGSRLETEEAVQSTLWKAETRAGLGADAFLTYIDLGTNYKLPDGEAPVIGTLTVTAMNLTLKDSGTKLTGSKVYDGDRTITFNHDALYEVLDGVAWADRTTLSLKVTVNTNPYDSVKYTEYKFYLGTEEINSYTIDQSSIAATIEPRELKINYTIYTPYFGVQEPNMRKVYLGERNGTLNGDNVLVKLEGNSPDVMKNSGYSGLNFYTEGSGYKVSSYIVYPTDKANYSVNIQGGKFIFYSRVGANEVDVDTKTTLTSRYVAGSTTEKYSICYFNVEAEHTYQITATNCKALYVCNEGEDYTHYYLEKDNSGVFEVQEDGKLHVYVDRGTMTGVTEIELEDVTV